MTNNSLIDLAFQITGTSLPADHGFALYGAISRLLPAVHEANGIAVHPIRGRIAGERQMQLTDASRLVIREDRCPSAARRSQLSPLARAAAAWDGAASRSPRQRCRDRQTPAGTPA